MPDNWSFVTAAYALAALVLGGYWRWLARRERELMTLAAPGRTAGRPDRASVRADAKAVGAAASGARTDAAGVRTDEPAGPTAETGRRTGEPPVRIDPTSRSRQPSMPGHPRPDASQRPPLP